MKQRAKLFILRHVVVIKRYYDLLGGIITHPIKCENQAYGIKFQN